MKGKVLIIAYYWPPAGGGGVQRWVKFTKYLVRSGFQPIVYIPENPSYPLIDESLLSEVPKEVRVVKRKIWEPYHLYQLFTGAGKDDKTSAGFIDNKPGKKSFTKQVGNWVRGNFFIPDARRFWIRPSIKFLKNFIKQEGIQNVITTGPPHSMHLIGLGLKQRTGVHWIADFRDPWVNMDNRDEMMMSARTLKRHEHLERKVLKTADNVVTVSWYLSGEYEKIRGKRVETITNGFDHEDFEVSERFDNEKFIIGHYGTFGADRDPELLWKALNEICSEDEQFKNQLKLDLVGPVDFKVKQSINSFNLSKNTEYTDYIPHDQIISRMQKASLLAVFLNQNANEEGRVTGKIFEYLAARRPVIGVGSVTSDCAKVIDKTGIGEMCAFNDGQSMKELILKVYSHFKSGDIELNAKGAEEFTRESTTRELISLLKYE